MMETNIVICGECKETMREFPDESIDLCVTSPPYWGLRDYGGDSQIWGGDPNCEHEWAITPPPRQRSESDVKDLNSKQATMRGTNYDSQPGNICVKCGAWRGSLGLEPHPQLYVDHLVEICREVKRVLKKEGSFWLNLGDSYFGGKGKSGYELPHEATKRNEEGKTLQRSYNVPGYMDGRPSDTCKQDGGWLQPKQKLMIPERTAMALQDDGWILRNSVIWYKPNHMPESVKDRLTKSYEFFFFFVKSRKYYFDLDSIRAPITSTPWSNYTSKEPYQNNNTRARYTGKFDGETEHENYGSPRARTQRYNSKYSDDSGLDRLTTHLKTSRLEGNKTNTHEKGKNPGDVWTVNTEPFPGSHFAVFPPELIEPIIKSSSPPNGIVLDPFAGSGTALRVARKLGRQFIGIELNPEYATMCEQRVRADTYTKPPENVPKLTEYTRTKLSLCVEEKE